MPTKLKSHTLAPRNPKLIRGNGGKGIADKQSPSAFLAEMALTTQERLKQTYEMRLPQIIELLDMSEMTHQKNTVVDIEEPLFQPFPSEIVFQNFEPHNTYKIPLQLRNNDQVARLVKVVQAQSPYFKIISPPDVGHKVAPGMDTIFHIHFTPDQKKDYDHELICITEREKFLVPIKGIGARGILDFPDEIHFGSCPVKYATTKTLLIRNIGNREANFSLLSERPFSLKPDKGVLPVGASTQIDVVFEPWKTGGCTSHIVIQYDTGEEVFVGLHGNSSDINVRLDKNTIRLENTYLGSASRRTVQLSNRSEVLVHYSWKVYATAMEEEQQRQMESQIFFISQLDADVIMVDTLNFPKKTNNFEEVTYYRELEFKGSAGSDMFLEECISDPLMRDKFSLISRSIKGKVKVAEDDKMFYEDKNIIIEPLEGEIWPGCNVDINIIFKPDEARTYTQTAYCDLTGRETRLPLRMRGDGVGPKIEFSFDTLDVENVFIGSEHSYEVVIANKGDIDAIFSYVPSSTVFGGQFAFSPSDGIVKAGQYQAIQILFSSAHLGQFSESFYWNVEGSKEQFQFNVRGCVVGPTFHFNVPYLKFGTVSYGFSYEQSCRLVNTSLIPMTFNLHMPTDGKGVVASDITMNFLKGHIDMNNVYQQIKKRPIEFEISPSQGVLLPLSEIIIQICYTPLSSGKNDVALMVDVEGIGKDLMSLPVSAKCIVPTIDIGSPLLDYGRCFIHHPYQRIVELHNDTDFPAKYELIAQSELDQQHITYSSRLQRGIIEARSVFEVPLDITLKTIGETTTFVYFSIYGSRHETLQVQVAAIGEGPVIHFSENQIDFGTVPVLTSIVHMVKLSNEALIPAQLYCEMVRPLSYFTVEPVSAIIPPETSMLLKVSAKVNDNVKFQDKLRVIVADSQTHTIHLTATGNGTTITVEPSFGPVFDLGPQFSSRTIQRKFRFHNKGRRPQQIYWLTEGFSHAKLHRRKQYNAEDMKYKNMPPPAEPPKPVFRLIPDRLSLAPGRYQDVILEGFLTSPRDVKERMVCQSIIGNSSGKEKIMTVDILANFIQPLLEFSEKKLSFTIIKQPDTNLSKETKELSLKNASLLPLLTVFKVAYPFQLLYETNDGSLQGTDELEFHIEKEATLLLQFDPNFVSDNYSQVIESMLDIVYKDHPSTDVLPLEGSVLYPNLAFEKMEVNFSSVLNDTEHVQTIKVTNHSPIDVYYTWSFIQHDICFEGKDEDEGLGKELSDSSDEEKFLANHSFNGDIDCSYLPSALGDRPKTSPVSSALLLSKRPSSAPPSVTHITTEKEKSSAVTWSLLKQPPLNVGIEEVFDILPLYGCLKASESQQFQFTFYGHSHIMADATAVCSVRGGPDYKIQLTGQASLIKYSFSQKEIDLGRQLYDQADSVDIELINTGKVSFDFIALNVNIGKTLNPGVVTVHPDKGVVTAGEKVILSIKFMAGVPEPFDKTFQIRVAHFEPEALRVYGVGVFPRLTLNLPKEDDSPQYEKFYEEAKRNLSEGAGNGDPSNQGELLERDIHDEFERLEVKYFALQERSRMATHTTKKSKLRLSLTSYVLDFGHVIIGTCKTEICNLSNSGYFPVSFYVDHQSIAGTGFYVDLDRVRGFPATESIDFEVSFNPSSVNLSLGPVETLLPIKILNGPVVSILLRSNVTMPDISLSDDMIEFGEVLCGQCKVKTIQVQNTTQVRCEWDTEIPEEKNEIDKFLPMHLRKKIKNRVSKPKIFEIMPPSCSLAPGQKINVQVKFMPTEEATYQEKLYIKVSQSSSKHFISCRGWGKEPHIEFEKSLFTFGPILPHSGKDEVVVKVTNPGSMPIEFYSLEFDKQYLEEEQVLRTLKGYDEFSTILLPPRKPGDMLPKQLLDHHEESNRSNEVNGKMSIPIYAKTLNNDLATPFTESGLSGLEPSTNVDCHISENDETPKEITVGDLEITPVSAAIAAYLGIDLSVEGRAARNRRGICIIVHGAPLSGKTATAIDLATKYNCAIVSIDDVVLEALSNGKSSAAIRARELCNAAARLAKANTETQGKVEAEGPPVTMPTSKLSGQPRKPSMMPLKKSAQANAVSPPAALSTTFISKKLDIIPTNPDEEFYNCVLPDDLLVELLAERLQVSDCHQGVVIDGLETMFTSSLVTAATILLRAINNRKYIYAVTLKFEFEALIELNATKVMEEERLKVLAEQTEWLYYEEMSEDEYDSLPDDKRKLIDQKRLAAKRERISKKKELKEQMEREMREKEEEEKRLDDERNKKGRKSIQASMKVKEKKSTEKIASVREINSNKLNAGNNDALNRPDTSLLSDRSGSFEDSEKRGKGKVGRQKSAMAKECPITPIEEMKDSQFTEEEKALKSRFQTFEQTLREILVLFDTWDRAIGAVATTESEKGENENDANTSVATSANKKSDKKKSDKDKLKEISESPALSHSSVDNNDVPPVDDSDKNKDGIGVPNVILRTNEPQMTLIEEVITANVLPYTDEVMDGIGVGPSGPPIPPEATFSVITYPINREAPSINRFGQHYTIIPLINIPSNLVQEEKNKPEVVEVEKPIEKKDSRKHKSRIDRQPSANTRKGRHSSLAKSESPLPPNLSPDKDSANDKTSKMSLDFTKYRWIVNPGESVDLRVVFTSQELGQFDQTLNFEIVGTRRHYQVFCRGICSFPNISREPRIVFPHRKKSKKQDEIVQKKYILSSETFEFGPILAGKNRERYREGRYPENMENICISNNSPMDAEISFAYLNDPNATTFLLEPPGMFLKPGQNQILTIWAYPKTPGYYEDTIVCCVKENPEPILFKVSTTGVRPELELDRRLVQFDRVLLHRKETRTVYLRNSTLLPVAWTLNGMENLGDDFSLTVDHGVIEPLTEFGLQMHFRAIKPVNIKKIVRLEVSDADNVMGLAHAENIQVQAEAYDVALDISFPKGADGGLDFGTLRVGEESKQTCTLKNKGRYEIQYQFIFEDDEKMSQSTQELFTVTPMKGSLVPSDRPTQVQVAFKSTNEICITDLPLLKCQIIEPSMSDEGEIIASIPVKIGARSVYSKYSIYPVNDINFGAVLVNTKKTRTFVIENKSEFDFRYSIMKCQNITKPKPGNQLLRTGSRQNSIYSGKSQQIHPQRSRRDSIKGESLLPTGNPGAVHNNIRLSIGMFSILPANGVVLPGGSTTITVEMFSEIAMVGVEDFVIDISERSPADNPNGVEYRLLGEACLPSILSLHMGFSSIFEEHRIVKNLNVFRYHSQELPAGTGVFGEDESKFIFYNVIVGHKAEARFKITNSNKVPCDVLINVKPISNKQANRIVDIFDVQPPRASIPPHGSIFAVVNFQPPSMQTYACIFDAVVEGLSASISKGRNLTFEIQGDGNLPRISIIKPITSNNKGSPIIVFNKMLVGRSQMAPIVIKNGGTLPSDVEVTLTDPYQSFMLTQVDWKNESGNPSPSSGTEAIRLFATSSKPVSSSIHVGVGAEFRFTVEFTPKSSSKMVADVRFSVRNNPFEDTTIQLIGEGYQEEVTIDNIQLPLDMESHSIVGDYQIDSDQIIVPSSNQLIFGDCAINVSKMLHFTIFNHSLTDTIRFHWDTYPGLCFKPSCGHLQPKCAKDVNVVFSSAEPCKLESLNVVCKVNKIIISKELRRVANWDDTKKVIHWIDEISSQQSANQVGLDTQPTFPQKKKVIEIEEEPAYSTVPDSYLEIDLICSANCNYAKYACPTDRIYFKDTYIFQTRVYTFTLQNVGDVSFDYEWSITPGVYHPPSPVEEVFSEPVKSAKSTRKGAQSALPKTQSPALRNSGMAKSKTAGGKLRTSTTTSEVSDADSASVSQVSRMGYTTDGRPASVMTLVYETGNTNNMLMQGTEMMPFVIEPECGSIGVGEEAMFTVRYSPLEVVEFDAILTANITNLDQTAEKPIIALHGRSLLPWCHFELPESSYIKERRNPELRGPNGASAGSKLASNTKTIEFEACGINTKVVKKFFVLNPTDTSYTFQWLQESLDRAFYEVPSNFVCRTPKGTIQPGKKFEMKFEYVVDGLQLTESFWRFVLPDQNLSVPFVLVGYGNEPAISFDRSHINFKQLLLGHTAKQIVQLLNEEDQSFAFSFNEATRHAPGHVASLIVEPMKGIVPGRSQLPISIKYKPEHESEVNFNLSCVIKKKNSPLTLNVKAQGFCVNMNLVCEDSTGNKVLLSPKGLNVIHFGDVEVNEKSFRQLFIENNGLFNLDYSWTITGPNKPKDNKQAWPPSNLPVTVTPDNGNVPNNSKRRCQIVFCPPCKLYLKNCKLTLKIVNGPTYDISITGSGCPPALDFSFLSHDFGPCFIYRNGLPVQKRHLHVTNNDTKDISLECLFTSTDYLEIHFVPNVISPGETKAIEIRFYPRELKQYSERVSFEVNGLSVVPLHIRGQGTDMRVEVLNAVDKKVNLGVVKVNEKIKRPVRITNNSLAPIEFTVTCTAVETALQNPNVLFITPNSTISLKPKGTCDVLVQFHPRTRVPQFVAKVSIECVGAAQQIFEVIGSCQGMELKLDSDAIPFGSVTLGSSSTRKLIMMNTGDLGTKFNWNVKEFLPSFNISPSEGYISPGMEVPFQITFSPHDVSQDIRCDDLRCTFENGRSLKLVLTGSCIPQMPMKEVVHFSTHVRNRDAKNITIHNKTNQVWMLKPIIEGEYWSAVENFIVEPQQSKMYEIIYRPLTMTQDQKKHMGSVFFALPDGSGLLYNLLGNADAPKPVSNIQKDVPCKMAYTELLNVCNWLRKPQRFRVFMEVIKPEKPEPSTTFKGLDYVDVPGLTKKEYKIQFFAHKEGTFSNKITFKNEQTGEFQFYYVTFKVAAPSSLGCIELTTPARQSTSHVVTLHNPLPTMVNFLTNCNIQDVNLPPQFTVAPQSEGACTFEYLPLKAGVVTGRLNLQSLELGTYMYDLNLTATTAAQERAVHFATTLGTNQIQPCKFISYARVRAEYSCKVDSPEFSVEKSINAASATSGGVEVSIDVTFEPSRLGDCQGLLTVVSPIGGEYTFPLYGHCMLPKPQGPYTIKAGGSTQIPFKNIFAQTTSFAFHVDNPSFIIKTGETIRAKKTHNIVVSFDGNQSESKAVRMGRLVVTCARSAGTGSNLSWTFYLKGVTQ